MNGRLCLAGALLGLLAAGLPSGLSRADQVDSDVIRLGSPQPLEPEPAEQDPVESPFGAARRGFDYESFESRLEALWFQRKAFLADGRESDAARQSELIRSFCAEEGVRRVESLAGALLAEARRYLREGHYAKALSSIELAEALDPGRPQISMARAAVYWTSGRGYVRAATELPRAFRLSVARAAENLSLGNHLAVVLVISLLGCLVVFSLLMLYRYQIPLRHQVEEWLARRNLAPWGPTAGWAVLLLPLLIWIAAGWAAVYWIVVTFRYMRRRERLAAASVLIITVLLVPAYRIAVAVYGVTTDPVVRTTLASAGGAYDPDRVVKLRQLVNAHPDDPIYRFLLAGLYGNGRYFEEAFDEYKQVVALDPSFYQAHINVGNIFYLTGKHAEALASYRRALELKPDSVLAYYNMHLAQSQSFHFAEAELSLDEAQKLDPKKTSQIMAASRRGADRPTVVDASVNVRSIWQAALEGRRLQRPLDFESAGGGVRSLLQQFLNPVSMVALLALGACSVIGMISRAGSSARRCIRCGRPFCQYCRATGQGQEYCSQCLHLFVLGDGLAAETKTRKLHEVEHHERWTRNARRIVSLVLPGAAHLLRGKAVIGCLLVVLWFGALVAWQPLLLKPLERLAGWDLRLDLLDAGPVPAAFSMNPTAILALVLALIVWLAGNVWRWRRAEA